MRYAFIEKQRTQHSVRQMCRPLEVSPAGFYQWRERPRSVRARTDEKIHEVILRVHRDSRHRYGRPRIHAQLRAQGFLVGHKRVGRIMKAAGIRGIQPRRFRKTTDSKHRMPIAPNVLARVFAVDAIGVTNRVWAGDITYLPTREGWLYLAVVLDLASRRVIGWSMDFTMQRSLVIDALRMALSRRRPKRGLMFHSDRGSQYASEDFRNLLKTFGVVASMSRKGDVGTTQSSRAFSEA